MPAFFNASRPHGVSKFGTGCRKYPFIQRCQHARLPHLGAPVRPRQPVSVLRLSLVCEIVHIPSAGSYCSCYYHRMIGLVILGLTLGLPLLLGLLLRVSATHLFFSVMAGELLGRYFGHDVGRYIQDYVYAMAPAEYGEVVLLVIPLVLTAIFLRGSLSKGKTILHIVPLLITGVVFTAFILPVLPASLQAQVAHTQPGSELLHVNRAIIGSVVLVQLIALWVLNRGGDKRYGRGKRRKGEK